MKLQYVALALSFGNGLCCKRLAASPDGKSLKRIRLTLAQQPDEDLIIYDALRTNDTRFFSQQMNEPNFVAGFKVVHLHFALRNCLPDILKVILCEPVIKELKETSLFCKLMLRELFKQSIQRKQSIMVKMLLDHIDPDYGLFTSGRKLQTLYRSIIDKYISSENIIIPEIDRRILWLIGLHFTFLDVMFFWELHLNTDGQYATDQARPYYARWLHDFLIALDTGDVVKIKEVLDTWDYKSNESGLIRLAVGEAIVDAGHYYLLPLAHATFSPMVNEVRYLESYANILKNAIVDGQFQAVYCYIRDVAFIPSLPILLSPIVNELIDEADIFGLFKAIPVISKPTPSQAGFMRLAAHVMAGDWKFLLVFMELHPNRIMISDRAWEILWVEGRTDDLLLTFAYSA